MADAVAYLKGVRNLFQVDPQTWFQPRHSDQAARAILSSLIVEAGEGRTIREAAAERCAQLLQGLVASAQGLSLSAPQQEFLAGLAASTGFTEDDAAQAVALFAQVPGLAPVVQDIARTQAGMQLQLLQAYEAATAFETAAEPGKPAGPVALVGGDEILASLAEAGFRMDGIRVESIKPVLGGYSKQTLICELAPPAEFGSRIVVRCEAGAAYEGASIDDEYATARGLHAAGIKVPRPLALNTQVPRRHFMIMEWVDGAMMGWTPTFRDEALCRECGFQLGRISSVDPAGFGHVPGYDRKPSEQMLRDIALREAKWRKAGGTDPVIAYAIAWLRERVALADSARGVVHGDYRGHNIMQKDGAITAILDWEHARIVNPAQDLGYARSFPDVLGSWDLFMEGYVAGGGTVPDAETLRFHEVYALVFTLVVLTEIAREYTGAPDQQLALAASIVHRVPVDTARLIRLLDLA